MIEENPIATRVVRASGCQGLLFHSCFPGSPRMGLLFCYGPNSSHLATILGGAGGQNGRNGQGGLNNLWRMAALGCAPYNLLFGCGLPRCVNQCDPVVRICFLQRPQRNQRLKILMAVRFS